MIGWPLLIVWAVVFFSAGCFVTYVWLVAPRDDVERLADEDEMWARRLARVADRRPS